MKEFIKRLGITILNFIKVILYILLFTIAGSLFIALLINLPMHYLEQFGVIYAYLWGIFVIVIVLSIVMWESIRDGVKWLFEPLKNKKEEDVE